MPFGCRPSLLGRSSPAGALASSRDRVTGDRLVARPQRGFHVPLHRDATGVGALYTPGSWCPTDVSPGCPPHATLTGRRASTHPPSSSPIVSAISSNGASSKVHSRSPVRSFPSPIRRDGSASSWTFPRCSIPRAHARRTPGGGTSSDTSLSTSFRSTTRLERPRVAPVRWTL